MRICIVGLLFVLVSPILVGECFDRVTVDVIPQEHMPPGPPCFCETPPLACNYVVDYTFEYDCEIGLNSKCIGSDSLIYERNQFSCSTLSQKCLDPEHPNSYEQYCKATVLYSVNGPGRTSVYCPR